MTGPIAKYYLQDFKVLCRLVLKNIFKTILTINMVAILVNTKQSFAPPPRYTNDPHVYLDLICKRFWRRTCLKNNS